MRLQLEWARPSRGLATERLPVEIRLLQSFMAIAEEGSITRAAEILHITQPALSRQLVSLEAELGCELFRRGKRRMELTDEGLLLQRRAAEILSLVALPSKLFWRRNSLTAQDWTPHQMGKPKYTTS